MDTINLRACEYKGFEALDEAALYQELFKLVDQNPEAQRFFTEIYYSAHNPFKAALYDEKTDAITAYKAFRRSLCDIIHELFEYNKLPKEVARICNIQGDDWKRQLAAFEKAVDVYEWPDYIASLLQLLESMSKTKDPRIRTVLDTLIRLMQYLELEGKREKEIRQLEHRAKLLRAKTIDPKEAPCHLSGC